MKMRSWNGFPRGVALVVTLLCFHHGIHAQNAANDRTVVKSTVPAVVLPSSADVATNTIDPALQVMTYNVGDGVKETMVYMEPSLEQMYAHTEPKPSTPLQRVTPKFKGFAGKFINMSNKPVTLYWEEHEGGSKHEMRYHEAFSASGTGTFPGHRFLFIDDEADPNHILHTMVVQDYPQNVYYYDPYYVADDSQQTEQNLKALSPEERVQYDNWRRTILFNEQYLQFTGRSYLANYLRPPPIHHMWSGDYFGQEHWVMTRETQFIQIPSDKELEPITTYTSKDRKLAENQPRILQQYRDPTKLQMNMTMKCVSVAPRVFEIDNFLSQVEVDHILKLAAGIELSLSKTGDGSKPVKDTTKTRTSYNSWVKREMSPILDTVYRRAADLLRIDEALLRYRQDDEDFGAYHTFMSNQNTLAEDLQLVHYVNRQQYEAHHDFGYAKINNPQQQGARFATVLLYLNEGMKGGQTSFPRWVNGETFHELRVEPKVGSAALFYSQLPDGNLDDFSQHAALPVYDGEKWLINLWVWDPIYD